MSNQKEKLSDEDLVELIIAGNSRYFSILSERYDRYIQSACRSYVKDNELADDLCQEVLIKVFMNLSGFRKEAKFSTWLYTIIHNTCFDHLRKSKANSHQSITEKLADSLGELMDDEYRDEREINHTAMELLLETLTKEDKLLLLMKYKEKYSIKDIKAALGLSESAIKMRISRAKEKLNRLYQQNKSLQST